VRSNRTATLDFAAPLTRALFLPVGHPPSPHLPGQLGADSPDQPFTSLGNVVIYFPKTIPAGHYSMLVSTTFQSSDRTLRDEELHAWSNSIVSTLESLVGRLRAQ